MHSLHAPLQSLPPFFGGELPAGAEEAFVRDALASLASASDGAAPDASASDEPAPQTHEQVLAQRKQDSAARNAARQKLMSEVDTHHQAMVAANEAAAKVVAPRLQQTVWLGLGFGYSRPCG